MIATLTELFLLIYKEVKLLKFSISDWQLTVNKNVKLRVSIVSELNFRVITIFFMTIGSCVLNAWAVCETLSEGFADYCMIVCD